MSTWKYLSSPFVVTLIENAAPIPAIAGLAMVPGGINQRNIQSTHGILSYSFGTLEQSSSEREP